MKIEDFKKLPNVEGYTIGNIRVDGEVLGFVLKNKKGEKKYILYFGKDMRIENYW